jgi:ferredoxin
VNIHYVCTHREARELVQGRDRFWVSNCGCREEMGECGRSRMDVCLAFAEEDGGTGSNYHEVNAEFVAGLFVEAEQKKLVTRPYRSGPELTVTGGICFCCDDCCGYFRDEDEECDPGVLIEQTDMGECDDCGNCVSVCYFNARVINGGGFRVDRNLCYGCGLCLDICPKNCIALVVR